jgi:serine protease Do
MPRGIRYLVAILLIFNVGLIAVILSGRRGGDGAPVARKANALSPFEPVGPAAAATLGEGSDQRRTWVVEAAEKVSPSVVSVQAIVNQVVRVRVPFFEQYGPFSSPYWLSQEQVPSLGSGLIVSEDGYILTNHHVVKGASQIYVTLADGRQMEAIMLDADTVVDIAVLKVEASGLPAAKLGSVDDLMIGEWVLAVGNPFGAFEDDPQPSVSIGVISATNRYFRPGSAGDEKQIYQDMIQTDAAINPGNSGGALANLLGEVIGINTSIYSQSGGSQGIGFAIPIDKAAAVYDEVRLHGRVRTLWLDFHLRPLNRAIARYLKIPEDTRGAVIWELIKDGAADRAGLHPGDIILRADKKTIVDSDSFYAYFWTLQVGAEMEIEVLRVDKTIAVKYVVEEGQGR